MTAVLLETAGPADPSDLGKIGHGFAGLALRISDYDHRPGGTGTEMRYVDQLGRDLGGLAYARDVAEMARSLQLIAGDERVGLAYEQAHQHVAAGWSSLNAYRYVRDQIICARREAAVRTLGG